jgi:response regulator RpfG family c-di-GMP phosphodiesterase
MNARYRLVYSTASWRPNPVESSVNARGIVLVIEEDDDSRASIHGLLESAFPHLAIVSTDKPGDALGIARRRPLAVLMGRRLQDTDGIELLQELRKLSPTTRRILMTPDMGTRDVVRAVNQAGVESVLLQPLDAELLLAELRKHMAPASGLQGRIPPNRP